MIHHISEALCDAFRAQVERQDAEIVALKKRAKAAHFILHVIDHRGGPAFMLCRWGRCSDPLATVEDVAVFLDRAEANL